MGHVIVKLEVMVDNRVIGMIKLNEMLESSGALFLAYLDIMYIHGPKVNGFASIAAQKT